MNKDLLEFISTNIMKGVSTETLFSDEVAVVLHKHPHIDQLRSLIKPEDFDSIKSICLTGGVEAKRFGFSLFRNIADDKRVKPFLIEQWGVVADNEIKRSMMWRLLDYPELEMEVHLSIYQYVRSNWDSWIAGVIRNYHGEEKYFQNILDRLNDSRFPASKSWAYLCGIMTYHDTQAIKSVLDQYEDSQASIVAQVVKDLKGMIRKS